MSTGIVPTKIVLKSSTSKTLSDRFGEIAKASRVENLRTSQREQSQASLKNRRLAAQMAKRMGLASETSSPQNNVKSRLSIPVTNRLGTRGGAQLRGRGRGVGGRTRGQRGTSRSGRATSKILRGNRPRGDSNRSRGGMSTRGERINRGGRGGFKGVRGGIMGRGKAITRGGRGRGRGRGRGFSNKPVTKEQLDTELDKYMSKTKSVLDSQLDEYMKGNNL